MHFSLYLFFFLSCQIAKISLLPHLNPSSEFTYYAVPEESIVWNSSKLLQLRHPLVTLASWVFWETVFWHLFSNLSSAVISCHSSIHYIASSKHLSSNSTSIQESVSKNYWNNYLVPLCEPYPPVSTLPRITCCWFSSYKIISSAIILEHDFRKISHDSKIYPIGYSHKQVSNFWYPNG